MRKSLLLSILIFGLSAAVLCESQSSAQECDFSSYKPLIVQSALFGAAAAVKRVEPQYPGLARKGRATGQVVVRILVDREGDVVKACVVRGHPLLHRSSVEAALKWKFKRNFGFPKRPKRKYIQSEIVFTFQFA
jgi:TonB family protein